MWIERLAVQNCRILKNIEINLSSNVNIIVGDNGSGKTSLIEALTLLSTGRSFRTSRIKELISHDTDSVLISARLKSNIINKSDNDTNEADLNYSTQIGIEKKVGKTHIRINQKDINTQSELSSHLPITLIHPDSIQLITGSPNERRAFIDWICFYSFPDFYSLWRRYKHILKQRNMCLKIKSQRYALDQWTKELVSLQPKIIDYRSKALELFQPQLKVIVSKLLEEKLNITMTLKSGFPVDVDYFNKNTLFEFYKQKEETDIKFGRTSSGAHRTDLNILINDIPAVQFASRGQLKLLAVSLLLAQSESISTNDSGAGIIIIDDLAAELDKENKKLLLFYLVNLDHQLILTSTDSHKLPIENSKVFHVKHGEISEFG